MRESLFVLQFNHSQIDALEERYEYGQDDEALAAGARIAAGHYDREDLKVIVRWKSARRAALIDDNSDLDIARSLRFASDSRTSERSAIETLTKLHGVGIPVASAILTLINPDRYTIIDYRALESLGVTDWPDSAEYYLAYLAACRELARRYHKSPRTLDRALWQWSKELS
jgi:hypothetical protein